MNKWYHKNFLVYLIIELVISLNMTVVISQNRISDITKYIVFANNAMFTP